MVRKGLLICGILAALLRVATDILAGLWYLGYSFLDMGILLVIFAALDLAQPIIPAGALQLDGGDSANTRHILITSAFILLIILFIGCGATSQGKSFGLYSLLTSVTLLGFGALAGLQAPKALQFMIPCTKPTLFRCRTLCPR